MIQLRPYQQDAVQAIRAAFGQRHRSVLFVLPTGGGKTTRWGPTEFWACYCGLLPVPARWRQP